MAAALPYEDADLPPIREVESGYASGSSSAASLPDIYLTKPHLRFLNKQLAQLEPEDILRWCLITLPSLYQTTAFGLSGLVTLDILSRLSTASNAPPLIFLDTLHHFPETLALIARLRSHYPALTLHVYKPLHAQTAQEFAEREGERLWETNPDLYDYVAKVEPAQRAYEELGVKAVLTGRRRSQGGKRGDLDILEFDPDTGIVKVNPLANWTFKQVQQYIKDHGVPYNELLDRGYKSVGDWHSTAPVLPISSFSADNDADERSGRWAGQAKTECGIHNPKSKYAQYLLRQQQHQESTSPSPSPMVPAEQALSQALTEKLNLIAASGA
ncbi:MAG: hypothetical protein M1829_005552 [Trizodia sp. TS-e1964]|nr:MAG: hypothetical protein M1829_005552 [Trizodia sp. TS-e1964]